MLLLALLTPLGAWADQFVNLTPRPKSMTQGSGTLTLTPGFKVSCAGLSDEMKAEVTRFVEALNATTGLNATVSDDESGALLQVKPASTELKEGGYNMSITEETATVCASDYLGMYYAMQTLKKLLPPHVMAGVTEPAVTSYSLPCLTIDDEPRFAYRGFMLDVSRHFFTVDEVKRMLDVMAYYKMNRFHWHLTDDQGWRAEIKKYPKLVSVGSIAPNSRFTDMEEGLYYINRPYGPYYYTQEQMREVVAYAAEKHIEVIPEVDMPGHFCAALAAYPEFSCTPEGSHEVQVDGGVYTDVLNVANPQAVQFAKDVIEELMEIFPSEYIHIGGDECPVNAWQANAECQARYQELGLTNYRQLQSHFIKEMADFVKSKGRKLAVWNEGITATGADLDIMEETGALVYCWTGADAAATKAQQLGMPSIYTPQPAYYINRKQSSASSEPAGAGDGTDDVRKTYNVVPPTATSYGVQGTFWCEYVNEPEYLEYLALPRLIAVAEAGWTPESRKDFADFQTRMSADTVLLNYGNYRYCKYHMLESEPGMVMPKTSTADSRHWYRLINGCTDDSRKARCIELLTEESPLVSTYSDKGAKAGVIWTNAQAGEDDSNYDAQWWSLEEDAANPGHYALVSKLQPEGSLNPTPTADALAGRWEYDPTTKHYSFQLGTGTYGTVGTNYYYSIASDLVSGKYLNSSLGGQGFAVNVYDKPDDGYSGQWEFSPADESGITPTVPDVLEEGRTYTFTNAVEGFNQTALADNGQTTSLQHSTNAFADNAWTVTEATSQTDGSQIVKLQNTATGRSISTRGSFVSREGRSVSMGTEPGEIQFVYSSDTKAYRLKLSGSSLFAMPGDGETGIVNAGSTASASLDAPRLQGAEWTPQEVTVVTLRCTDEQGEAIATYHRSIPVGTEFGEELCPTLANHTFVSVEAEGEATYHVVYQRTTCTVTYDCRDTYGAIVATEEVDVPAGESYTVALPELKYYTLQSADKADGETFTPTADTRIAAIYTTDAYSGVKSLGETVTEPLANHSYVIYDAVGGADAVRAGYRKISAQTFAINKSNTIEGQDPTHVWTLEPADEKFKVKNEYTGMYVPQLQLSAATTGSTEGDTFSFTLNEDGFSFAVLGTNGMYWDGIETGDLVGWNQNNGHPIRLFEYVAEPWYTVNIECVDEDGTPLQSLSELVKAGSEYTLTFPEIEGHSFKSATGHENFEGTVEGYLNVTAIYHNVTVGIDSVETDTESGKRSELYDLSGRRLRHATRPGVYILDGKKVLLH